MSRLPVQAMSTFTAQGARPSQEDFVSATQHKGIFVVADGFGGPVAGAAAARAACEGVRGYLEKEAGDLEATMPFVIRSYFSLAGNVLFNALVHANRKVLELNRGRNVHEKGGASVVAGFVDEDLLALANVGACTAWLFRGGRVAELVVPRTYARLCDPFTKDPAPELQAPLMAMGMSEDLEPEITEYRLRPGDWLLLSTDGLDSTIRDRLLYVHQQGLRPAQAIAEAEVSLKTHPFSDNGAASLVLF